MRDNEPGSVIGLERRLVAGVCLIVARVSVTMPSLSATDGTQGYLLSRPTLAEEAGYTRM